MTYEEIEGDYDLGEITPRMDALLRVLLDDGDYKDEIFDLVENNLFEDDSFIVLAGEEFDILTDKEMEESARDYVQNCTITDVKYNLSRSDLSYLEHYINWSSYEQDEVDDYVSNYDEINGYNYLGSCFGYSIYKR